jgi:DoxX-like family
VTSIAATPAPATATATATAGRRAGVVASALTGAFLVVDAVLHVLNVQVVQDAMHTLGFGPGAAVGIGLVEIVCVGLYLMPRTSVLGAVLLTGYLGGAVCAQLRIDAPLFSTMLFPVYVGTAVWVGLWLRDARVRRLLGPS